MTTTPIRIKRSTTTSIPLSLNDGELAYTANGDVLFLGSNGVIVPIGGKRNPGVLTANQALVTNSTSYLDKIQVSNAVLTSLSANGSIGSDQILYSNSVGGLYWGSISSGTASGANTQIQFNDSGNFGASAGITFDKSTNNFSVSNNISGLTYTSGANVTINTSSLFIGNSSVNTNITGGTISLNGSVVPSNNYIQSTFISNSAAYSAFAQLAALNSFTANNSFGGSNTSFTSNVTFASANIDATSSLFRIRDVTVSGNLVINGTLTTVDTNNLQIKDSIIKLADSNLTADTIDSGFYSVSGNSTNTFYSGIARIASSSALTDPYYTIFSSTTEPSTTISANNIGTLHARLDSFGLISNLTNVSITANSTLAVSFVANTLSLTTALPGTSGGTGLSSFTNQDILVGNTTNGLSKLSVGADGYILSSNAGVVTWSLIDGGTF